MRSVLLTPLENDSCLSLRIVCAVDDRTCTSRVPESNVEKGEVALNASALTFTSLSTRISSGSASTTACSVRMLVEFCAFLPLHPGTNASAATAATIHKCFFIDSSLFVLAGGKSGRPGREDFPASIGQHCAGNM